MLLFLGSAPSQDPDPEDDEDVFNFGNCPAFYTRHRKILFPMLSEAAGFAGWTSIYLSRGQQATQGGDKIMVQREAYPAQV